MTTILRLPFVRFVRPVSRPRRFLSLRAAPLPWEFGFQVNERYLRWSQSAQAQLVKLVVQDRLELTSGELQSRLEELHVLLPDLTERLDTLTAYLLADLVRDPDAVASRILLLKRELPNLNLADAVRRYPEIVASHTEAQLRDCIAALIRDFDGDAVRVGELLSKEPRCLKIRLSDVLPEVRRLMPSCQDPVEAFTKHPGQFLSMEQMGLESSN